MKTFQLFFLFLLTKPSSRVRALQQHYTSPPFSRLCSSRPSGDESHFHIPFLLSHYCHSQCQTYWHSSWPNYCPNYYHTIVTTIATTLLHYCQKYCHNIISLLSQLWSQLLSHYWNNYYITIVTTFVTTVVTLLSHYCHTIFTLLSHYCHTIRGLTEENTQLGKISPIGYFKSPIGDILSNWGLVICSLTLHYQTHISPIPNWIHYPQLCI